MNSHRDGWPPTSQTPINMQANSDQSRPQGAGPPTGFGSSTPTLQQPPSSGPVLPPPPAPFHPAGAGPTGPSLPTLPGMAQPGSSSLSQHRTSHTSHEQTMGQQSYPGTAQGPSYSMPSLGQPTAQPSLSGQQTFDRERERELQEARDREVREARDREFEQHSRREQQRERENRDREMRGRHQREQPTPHQNHAEPMQLHQPAPVGPQMRTAIHGPNGLLSSTTPASAAQNPAPGSIGPSLFGGSASHNENAARGMPQQASQVPNSNIVPFGGPQGAHQMPGPGLAQGQQPILNDALSYLDQVKVQFVEQPSVYNLFLDIMKDFKSQAIDTPGVIRRVSQLFAGHPNLIQGFNTFLPPGYRIECGTADDPNAIRVTTPMGTTVSPMGSSLDPPPNVRPGGVNGDPQNFDLSTAWQQQPGNEAPENAYSPRARQQGLPPFGQQPGQGPNQPSNFDGSMQRDHSGLGLNAAAMAHQQEQRNVSQLSNAAVAAGDARNHEQSGDMHGLGAQQGGPAGLEKRGPVEFNHAISYVNKIKNRFSQQPEIYKQFLEILQTYQRESKPIQDVYAQVTHLFNGAPDLLEDFKQFLPESAAQAKAAAAKQAAEDATMLSSVRTESTYPQSGAQVQHTPRTEGQHRLPPLGNFAPTPSSARDAKRKRGDRAAPGFASSAQPDYGPSNARNGNMTNKRSKHLQPQQQQQQSNARAEMPPDAPVISPTLVPALPEPLPPNATSAASSDELAAFDRVKKFIGNKNTMNEFLKLCNLFSQDLIDRNLFIHRTQNFIGGNPELFQWFKDFVAYDGKDEVIENRARPVTGRVSLSNCRGLGPSYRLLPKRERNKKCSGRDEICNAVLNDDWATHPTWASEESGFAAHRKNIHEDGLHRIEEERHDYDLNIGICERTIQLLEPIAQHIRMLPDEEKPRYVLPPHLGGPSETIYKRMIMKIYGREQGRIVIENLYSAPLQVVPVVLMRCRQKLEEWKASQREWEKVWREQTQKMFWKSLDHQGLNAKMVDKRQFQPKTLQNEIQVKYEEQKRQRHTQYNLVPKDQATYSFEDVEVLTDATRLLLMHAEQAHSTDFPRLTAVIRDFVPLFFGLDANAFEERIRDIFEGDAPDDELDDDAMVTEGGVSAQPRKSAKRTGLLRNVLEKGRNGKVNRKENDDSASASRSSTPAVDSITRDVNTEGASNNDIEAAEDLLPDPSKEKWLEHPVEGNVRADRSIRPNEPYQRRVFHLYANADVYCFFRLFVILYERLCKLKQNEAEVHETVRRAKFAAQPALDLHMVDKQPSNFFIDTSLTANYYEQMLRMLEDNVKGDLEMGQIEEVLRRYYLSSGWMLYSFDRLLSALARFATSILGSDGKKSWEIVQLWMKDRKKEYTTHEDELTFRRQVEKYIKEGDMYRIAYDETARIARVRILGQEDATFSSAYEDAEGLLTPEQRWQHYVSSYSSLPPTEGLPLGRVRFPFLKSVLRVSKEAKNLSDEETVDGIAGEDAGRLDQIRSKEGLVLRISVDDYKIWYTEPESEEWWIADKRRLSPKSQLNAQENDAEPMAEEGAGERSQSLGHDGEARHEHESRDSQFQEKFVMNNSWMAGKSRDEVESFIREFREFISGDLNAAPGGDDDAEMAD